MKLKNLTLFLSFSFLFFTSCDDEVMDAEKLPSVSTNQVSDITGASAICGGNIDDDAGSTVIERGVVWDTIPNPTIENYSTKDGSGGGFFESTMENLTPGTKYYVRAYATNGHGTDYGMTLSFSTLSFPEIGTTQLLEITSNSAIISGTVSDQDASDIIAMGICWGQEDEPTIEDNTQKIYKYNFEETIKNLNPNTKYYVRVYVISDAGTNYGNTHSFATKEEPVLKIHFDGDDVPEELKTNEEPVSVFYTINASEGVKSLEVLKNDNILRQDNFVSEQLTVKGSFEVANNSAGDCTYTVIVTDQDNNQIQKSFIVRFVNPAGDINIYSAVLLGNQNAEAGASYSTSTDERFTISQAKANASKVDFIHYKGATNGATIASPDGDGVAEFSVFDTASWSTLNSTRFKSADVDFDAIADDGPIVPAAEDADLKEATNLSVGDVFAFVTEAGKKGVFEVSAVTDNDITIEVKVQK